MQSSLKFVGSYFSGASLDELTRLSCLEESSCFVYEVFSLRELILPKPYPLLFLVKYLTISGVDVFFLLPSLPSLQNGTKDSISKLVSELNAATLETDVGKAICLVFTYLSLPLYMMFAFHNA